MSARQPLVVGRWCTLCLASAVISVLMIGPALDEVLASLQHLRRARDDRRTSMWSAFWGRREQRIGGGWMALFRPERAARAPAGDRPRVVVITGASAGVGRAAARAFAAQGARIGLLARGVDGLDAARREVEQPLGACARRSRGPRPLRRAGARAAWSSGSPSTAPRRRSPRSWPRRSWARSPRCEDGSRDRRRWRRPDASREVPP